MNLLAPLALWGLLAGMVPLLLHLRRRRVGRTIQVGSLKHLDTLPTAERRGHRLRDPLRLLLRLAILGALVLSLADPALPTIGRTARPFILIDSLAPPAVIDSLRRVGEVHLERLDDPWRRVQSLDDSLAAEMPLMVAASARSDRYAGPRPVVGRQMAWFPYEQVTEHRPVEAHATAISGTASPAERRALAIAVTATSEEFGPLTDSAGWMGRLPSWWRDSLDNPSFPLAVARAVAPGKATPRPVAIGERQLLPRREVSTTHREGARDLHWWFWGLALVLFVVERLWTGRVQEEA